MIKIKPEKNAMINTTQQALVILACSILVVLSLKIYWLVSFWHPLPYWDDWATGLYLLEPYNFNNLFAAHNEHRIVMTRLLALFSYKLSSYWNPKLEMILSVIIHCLSFSLLLYTAFLENKKSAIWIAAGIIFLYSVPISYQSLLMASQSQFYFLMLFFLLALYTIVYHEKLILSWMFCLGSFFSMSSGFLSFIIVAAALVWKRQIRDSIYTLLLSISIVPLMVHSPHHDRLIAHDLLAFIKALYKHFFWPDLHIPLLLITWLLYCISVKRSKNKIFLSLVGSFVILQLIAMAYYRGEDGSGLIRNRYLEIHQLGLIMSWTYSLQLIQQNRTKILLLILLAHSVFEVYREQQRCLRWKHSFYTHKIKNAAKNFELYLISNDPQKLIQYDGTKNIPFPDSKALIEMHGKTKTILPSPYQLPSN